MNGDVYTWLLPAVGAFAAAVLGAIVGLRQGQEQQVWTVRHEAYRDIVAAAHDIYFWAQSAYADEFMLPSPGAPADKALHTRFQDAKYRLSAHCYAGQLVISSKAREATESFLSNIAREEFEAQENHIGEEHGPDAQFGEYARKVESRAEAFLESFGAIARKDLLPWWRIRLA